MPFEDALECDRLALIRLGEDVRALPDAVMSLPTPCAGWTVRDLVEHMNVEHTAICGGRVRADVDPRAEFTEIVDRWLSFFAEMRGSLVRVPQVETSLPSELVLSVHFADMLVHRWDLAASLGVECDTDARLLDRAVAVAEVVTNPERGLVGDGGVYAPALPHDPAVTPLENLVRMYGRDHRFESGDHVRGAASRAAHSVIRKRHGAAG